MYFVALILFLMELYVASVLGLHYLPMTLCKNEYRLLISMYRYIHVLSSAGGIRGILISNPYVLHMSNQFVWLYIHSG